MDPRQPLSILVTDYDQCAFTSQGTHMNMLSNSLIKHASEGGYAAFYGCTHRCYSMMPMLRKSAVKKKTSQYTEEDFNNNFPTYKITANFEYITRVPCLAVSTLEDSLRTACGSGYTDVIKPFELEGIEPDKFTPYVKFKDVGNYSKSKNNQLRQVAAHASQTYPDAPITLNYIDDNKSLCKKALTVTDEPNWPANISLNIFHHVADRDDAPITPIEARKFEPRGVVRSPTKQIGFFSESQKTRDTRSQSHILRDEKRY